MLEQELAGSCLCGVVRYRVRGPWKRLHHCHCSRCRRRSGAAHTTTLFVDGSKLEWSAGAEYVTGRATSFCAHCGAPLPLLLDNGATWGVPAGSLDEHPNIRPQFRIFWGSRAAWSCAADDDAATHEEW